MKSLKLLSFLFLFVSCNSKTESSKFQKLDFGVFTLQTPKGWTIFKEKGIDSYVGGLTNGKDSLWFDYGWYSAEIENTDFESHLYTRDTINGLIAEIEIPKIEGKGSIRLSIPNINNKDKFNLGGYNINKTEPILQIFKSITFKESDTTKNSLLTITKFKEKKFGSGKMIFNQNCAACHSKNLMLIGPALSDELMQSRPKEWLMTFFFDRKNLKVDSLYKARKKYFGETNCIEFEKDKKEEIEQLLLYLTGK
ncbi:MAG: cytochrome c [Flavobacterium sp.]|nr:cytochrome c [Flavobacterium sp.]